MQAITLGMHRGGSNSEFDPIERNTRRQVWWSIYILEKILCSILGRPTVIDDVEMKMRLPDASMFEQQGMSGDFMAMAFDLCQISYRIRQRAYFDSRTAEERSPTVSVAVELLRECDHFHSKLPRYLLPDFSSPASSPQRAKVLLLHVYYYYTRCIVTRDFLIQKVERDISYMENRLPPISEDWDTTFALSEDCVESAHQSIRCIMAGQDMGLIVYSYIDLFFVIHSVLILCADFLARPKEQQISAKDRERQDVVRAMLDHVRGLKRLAPTYIILKRIAMQFASMTGVYEEPGGPDTLPSQGSGGTSPEQLSASGHDSIMSNVAETSDFEEDWFASATNNLGLDFFDLNQMPGGASTPAGQAGDAAFPGYGAQPMVNQVDDWTTRTLRGMHNI
jgi:proline utilization trans-activator